MPFSQDVTPIFFYCCLLAILPGDLLSRVVAKNTTRLEKNESIGNKDLKWLQNDFNSIPREILFLKPFGLVLNKICWKAILVLIPTSCYGLKTNSYSACYLPVELF